MNNIINLTVENDQRLKQLFITSMKAIKYEYNRLKKKNSDYKFIISFSGGKDSTITAIVTIEAIKKYNLDKNDFLFIYADTGYEMINLHNQVLTFFSFVKSIGFKTLIAKHDLKNDILVKAIGEGKGFPQQMLKWCVTDLKITPIKKKLKKFTYISIVGLRFGESITRDKTIRKNIDCDPKKKCLKTFDNENRIVPILNWKTKDIWNFLEFYKKTFYNYPVQNLRKIYLEKNETRYGCWICTVSSNSTLKSFFFIEPKKYDKMLNFFNLIKNKYSKITDNKNGWFYIYDNYSKKYIDYAKARKWKLKYGKKIISCKLLFSERRFLLKEVIKLKKYYEETYNMKIFDDKVIEYTKKRIDELETYYLKTGTIKHNRKYVKVFKYKDLVNNGLDL